MNIYEKMMRITADISTVAKNLNVDTGKGKGYKAVSEADVLAAVKPIEAKYGVYSYPFSRSVVDSGEMITQTNYGERKQLYLRIETVYRFVNIEKPDEFIDITTYGDGVDTQDKAPGKAMTYADKYGLLKAYKIQTGDDPDKDASADLVSVGKKTRPAEPSPMKQVSEMKISDIKVKILEDKCREDSVPVQFVTALYKVKDFTQMSEAQFSNAVNNWGKIMEQAKA